AVVLAARTLPAHAANADDQAVESLVPMPDTSLPPPPTARDVTPPAAPAATATPAAAPAYQTAADPPLSTLDQQVAHNLPDYLTGKTDRIIERRSHQGRHALH